MSSHHFVKEQQEPALLILTTEGWDLPTLNSLLEWVPTVLVTQETVFQVLSLGIKVDVIVGHPEFHQDNEGLSEAQFPVKFVPAVDNDYLDASIAYLNQSTHHAVNILAFDPTASKNLEPYLDLMDIVFVCEGFRYSPARKGIFQKWLPKTTIQLQGKEGQMVTHKTAKKTELINLTPAASFEVPEGMHWFESDGLFWMGTRL
ncbi:MAG: thiamine pyrophosphokinase [Cyclobacterium sp.]|uniref:thiamine pyrophosphokinase n=1 Tax=Cyclobacterium sp. TaxID=1966343 RepID=UPI0039707EF2